jgi:GR25 family glycosyltransferase involved in LPS biosynthesis
LKTYVAHCKRLEARKIHLSDQLDRVGLTAEWIEAFDPPEIPNEVWLERVASQSLSEGEVSIYLKHEHIYRTIAASDDPLALVLEDDVIFARDFDTRFRSVLERVPSDFDVIFLASSIYLPIPVSMRSDNSDFLPINKSRTTAARLVSREFARRMTARLSDQPIETSNDLTLDKAIREMNFKSYWLRDALFVQGSETGAFSPSVGVPWREPNWPRKLKSIAAKRIRHWRTRGARANQQWKTWRAHSN